jgi:hypothetical protein
MGHTEAEAGFPMREVWSPDEIWSAFIERLMIKPPLGKPVTLPVLRHASPGDEG